MRCNGKITEDILVDGLRKEAKEKRKKRSSEGEKKKKKSSCCTLGLSRRAILHTVDLGLIEN
jgi:hypothetical protein